MHTIVGLFEMHETKLYPMVGHLQFEFFYLISCVIDFVKNESNNSMLMVTSFHSNVDYHPLKLQRFYEGTCFGRIMFKACQCATNDVKVKF